MNEQPQYQNIGRSLGTDYFHIADQLTEIERDYWRRTRDFIDDEVLPAVERFAPELLVVACGFDAHAHDPLADLELRSDTFGALTTRVVDLAARLGTPPPALLLEGGYDLAAVRDSTTAVVRALAAA